MYYRIAGSSEPSTHTFLTSGTCLALGAVINAYDNPDTSTPYQAGSVTTVTGTGTSISLPGITTANPNALLVGAVYSDGGGSPSTFTSGALSERIDSGSLWLGDTLQAIAGASGNKAVTASNSGVYRGFLAAFNSEPAAPSGPTINTHPSNQTVTEPATATFSVSATASEGSLSYQWQVNSGGGWGNVSTGSGGTTSSYTTAATTSAMNGYQYRCAVSDANGTTNSNAATLTVNEDEPPAPSGGSGLLLMGVG